MMGILISGAALGIIGSMIGGSYSVVNDMTEDNDEISPANAQRGMWIGFISGALLGGGGYYYFFHKSKECCEIEDESEVENEAEPEAKPEAKTETETVLVGESR